MASSSSSSRKRTLDWDVPSSAPKKQDTNDVNPWSGRKYSPQYYEILAKRKELPVWEQKQEFYNTFNANQCMVLQGETGSGKTTQVRAPSSLPLSVPLAAACSLPLALIEILFVLAVDALCV